MDQSRQGESAIPPLHLLPVAVDADAVVRVHLLGGFTITLGERSIDASAWHLRKAQSMVKLLALAPGHRLHRDRVLELFWPDLDVEAAANNLHYIMHSARNTLGRLWEVAPSSSSGHRGRSTTSLHLRQQILALDFQLPLWVDVEAFEADTAAARHGTDTELYENAIALYRGDLLPDDLYEDWASHRREELRTTYLALLLAVAQLYVSQGNHTAAIEAYQRALAADAAHEEAHRQVMRLYALSGQRHQALRQFVRMREALQRELEMPPSAESRGLYDDILAGRLTPEPVPPRERLAGVDSATKQAPPLRAPDPTPPTTASESHALVGRKDVLARLRDVWTAAATRPQALLIMGEAGIGKSRVAEEALAWAAHHSQTDGQPIATATAYCYSAEGELPFKAAVTWLRSSALWPGVLTLDEVWQGEVSRVIPELSVEIPHLQSPAPLPEDLQRLRLFDALVRAVHQSGRPLLLVIDDLQWCERETLEWLRYLLRQPTRAPMLVLGTARAEEVTYDHPLLELIADLQHSQQVAEIKLGPLNAAETATLAAEVVGSELSMAQAERLYAETEGHPLFIVELVRARLLDRLPQPASGAMATTSDAATPLKMQAVLDRRLGQLSPGARELAGLAAVVGREFSAELLIEASRDGKYSEDSLVQGLEELQQRRIVRERGAITYDFSHDKLREAAYAELSGLRRRTLHRRVARALETVFAEVIDEISAQLAVHYERGGEIERAVAALERAAHVAIRRGMLPSARTYIRHAIELAPDRDQIRLYEELGDSYVMFGAFDPYLTALERWRRLDAEAQYPLVGARLLRKLLYVRLRAEVDSAPSPEELVAMADAAQQLADRTDDEDESRRVRIAALCLSWRHDLTNRPVICEDALGGRAEILSTVDYFATRGDWDVYNAALDVYTSCLQGVGALSDALEVERLRLRAPHLPPHEYGDVVGMFALINFMMGNYEQCMADIRNAWSQSRPDVPLLISNPYSGPIAALLSGNWDELDLFIAVSERVWVDSGGLLTDCFKGYWDLLHVGLAREDRTTIDVAIAKLEEWQAVGRDATSTTAALLAAYRTDDPTLLLIVDPSPDWMLANRGLALMFLNERNIVSPPTIFDVEVFQEARFVDFTNPIVHVAEALASDDPTRLAAAIDEAEAHKLIPHAARMRIVLAQRTCDRTHLDRARPVLERLGDRQFLRRLEAVAATLP